MSVPDYRAIVFDLFATGRYDVQTKAGAGWFIDAVAPLLHAADANFGHLLKPEGRTHVVGPDGKRHAVDVVLYRANGEIVDVIKNAGEAGATVYWGPSGKEHEYGEADWYAPLSTHEPPIVTPVPPIVTPPTVDLSAVLSAIDGLRLELVDVREDMADLKMAMEQRPAHPNYAGKATGSIEIPFVGRRPVSLDVVLNPEA